MNTENVNIHIKTGNKTGRNKSNQSEDATRNKKNRRRDKILGKQKKLQKHNQRQHENQIKIEDNRSTTKTPKSACLLTVTCS